MGDIGIGFVSCGIGQIECRSHNFSFLVSLLRYVEKLYICPIFYAVHNFNKARWKQYKVIRELLEATDSIEKYRVKAHNQSFVLQNNRPLIERKGLQYFPFSWKVLEGGYNHTFILEQIFKAIDYKIKWQ